MFGQLAMLSPVSASPVFHRPRLASTASVARFPGKTCLPSRGAFLGRYFALILRLLLVNLSRKVLPHLLPT